MAEDNGKWNTGLYGTPGQLASEGYPVGGFEEDNADELDQLHGEFAEIGSPADEEATKLRVEKLMDSLTLEANPKNHLALVQEFVLEERRKAAEVATRLTVARGVSNSESFVESMKATGAYSADGIKTGD